MGIIFVIIIAIFIVCCIIKYNRFIEIKHDIQNSWSTIDSILNQRHDVLPKLIDICTQHLSTEEHLTLEDVTNARTAVSKARQSGNISALADAENTLRVNQSNLMAITDQYPQLQTDHAFQKVKENLNYLESELSIECELYNEAVQMHNILLEQFPALVVARIFNFTTQLPLTLSTNGYSTHALEMDD
ncbi:LemA family protein [Neisseria sp. Ec49-e6-T10]|uniref:LemA family protein n=1 Tax=Neisseria sp. Ec49-e6-T10 TaxID=3140744 RepID=UPI003EBF4A7B